MLTEGQHEVIRELTLVFPAASQKVHRSLMAPPRTLYDAQREREQEQFSTDNSVKMQEINTTHEPDGKMHLFNIVTVV